MGKRIIIIGAGAAGLTCALVSAKSGFDVILIEEKDYIGGRAHSFYNKDIGEEIDNGQHIAVGAYNYFFKFLKMLGTETCFYKQPALDINFVRKYGETSRLNFSQLPGRAGMLAGIIGYGFISLTSKLKLIKFGISLKKNKLNSANKTALQLLHDEKQDEEIIENFWEPLIYAALNASPAMASAHLLATVLDRAFFSGREAGRLLIPKVSLAELFMPFTSKFIGAGGKLLLKKRVEKVIFENSAVIGVKLKSGEEIYSDYIVSAVPYFALDKILPKDIINNTFFEGIRRFEPSPIVSAYMWFDRQFTIMPVIALFGTTAQWLFIRRILSTGLNMGREDVFSICLTTSAANDIINMNNNEIRELFLGDLKRNFPSFKGCRLLKCIIIKEKRATMLCTPESDKIRPLQKTPFGNFYISGDWTSTGLPATLEGASQSGFTAAELIKSSLVENH